MGSKYIDIHTHNVCEKNSVCIRSYSIGMEELPADGELVSAGIHPWHVNKVDVNNELSFLKDAPLKAIGEIGLDYSTEIDKSDQVFVFESQLKIAESRNLPVLIHCVKAYNDVLHIISHYKLKAVIFHGYIGSPEQTESIINKGYYISLGERSIRSKKTVDAIKKIPLERLFAETDDSTIPISSIYAYIAELINISVNQLKKQIAINYKSIFK